MKRLFTVLMIVALLIPLMVTGCTPRAELTNVREGLVETSRTMWKLQDDWTQKLASGQRDKLPVLTADDVAAEQRAHARFDELVAKSRAGDGTVAGGVPYLGNMASELPIVGGLFTKPVVPAATTKPASP